MAASLSVARGTALTLLGHGAAAGGAFLLSVLLARSLPPDECGRIWATIAFAMLFVPLADLGASSALQVMMARQDGDASRLLRASVVTRACALVPVAALMALMFPRTEQSAGILVVMPIAFLAAQSFVLHTDIALVGRQRPRTWALRRLVLESCNLLAVGSLVLLVAAPTANQVLGVQVAAVVVTAALANAAARGRRCRRSGSGSPRPCCRRWPATRPRLSSGSASRCPRLGSRFRGRSTRC
jgi:O-antigen/teichoic acid export membrane protein